jgi:hypothetical protein
MPDNHETNIGDAISKLIANLHIDKKLNEVKIAESWKALVGEAISKHVTDLYVKDNTLFVKVDSSVVRQELNFMKRRLVDKINRLFDKPFIDQITVL